MSIVSSLKGREIDLSFHLVEYICKSFKVTLDMLLFYKEGCKKTGFMNNRYMIHYHEKAVKNLRYLSNNAERLGNLSCLLHSEFHVKSL